MINTLQLFNRESMGCFVLGKFIILTFIVLGWTFYEMSGGADFVPETREMATARQPEAQPQPTVTRSIETPTLISLNMPVREVATQPQVKAQVIPRIPPASEAEITSIAAPALPAAPAPEQAPAPDVRSVAGNRVNMRTGPGTNFGVINAFSRGTEAEVLMVDDTGWAQIRILDTGQTGWMAERLLSDS